MTRVVIIGRPNVGKSTLFNRLAGARRALVHDLPGMTRDRLNTIAELDDGRRYELTDTGGLEYGASPLSAYAPEIRAQTPRALASRILLLVNKTDRRDAEESVSEFYELGYERVMPISAEHGGGVDAVIEAIAEIATEAPAQEKKEEPVRVAIIGRPNVGKSSLLNRLTSEERAVVSPISGTTRDAIDSEIVRDGKRYLLIDTAGIRRKGKTTAGPDKLAVISARKAIERCEIALVMLDATEGVTAQDATVAGYAEEAGKAALIVVN